MTSKLKPKRPKDILTSCTRIVVQPSCKTTFPCTGQIRLLKSMEPHSWHLMLNIYKHTTSYNMYCSYFFIRSILNLMCDSLNTLCCSFLITRSGFVIMRCRSYKWCSSLIITCCAFINCRATCYFTYSRYNIVRSTEVYHSLFAVDVKPVINCFRVVNSSLEKFS